MAGLNINRKKIDAVIGVVKAYTTRVGAGPFPTEFSDEAFADNFRQKSREFGVSTGRPRRCGWLDLGKQLPFILTPNILVSSFSHRLTTCQFS